MALPTEPQPLRMRISFFALAIASKKLSKTISETRAKWLQFGAVSETRGLAFFSVPICWKKENKLFLGNDERP